LPLSYHLHVGAHPNVKHWWRSIGPTQTQVDNPDDPVVEAFGVMDDMHGCELSC